MRLWLLPFRLIGILVLALLLSGAWLLRDELVGYLRPQVAQIQESFGAGGVRGSGGADAAGTPAPGALDAARDKVDSMHGWAADSVVLSAQEMASLLVAGLPAEARTRLDSVSITLADDRVTVRGRLETTRIPTEALGLLAGALAPWESVSGAGAVAMTRTGWAEWRVDALTIRGFTLPAASSRQLVSRALPGVENGAIPFALPHGIANLRVRAAGVTLYREGR